MNVLLEAVLVGLVLIPMYWVAEKLVALAKPLVGGRGKWVTLFVAGALFHLTFEVTGLNKSYAQMKA